MVLPLLFSALAPSVLAGTGIGALGASAIGAGLGGLIESGGDLETGLLTGLGAFAGGSLLGGVMGGGAGAAGTGPLGTGATAPTAANLAKAQAAGLPSLRHQHRPFAPKPLALRSRG